MFQRVIAVGLLFLGMAVSAGEIERYHADGSHDRRPERDRPRTMDEIQSTDHGITEIAIERTPCFGKCPVYTAVIRSDGTFRFQGEANVRHLGRQTGRIPAESFHDLAKFINDSDYMRLHHSYDLAVTDLPAVYTSVVKDGRRKVIRNYGNAGPTKLWAVEQLIDKLLLEAKWDQPMREAR